MINYETMDLEIDESNNLAIIFFNRPKQFNAFDMEFVEDLIAAFNNILSNHEIRCIILTGRGKAFSAGGDIVAFKNAENLNDYLTNLAKKLHKWIQAMKNMEILSIAAINGACLGGGLGIATACDFRICSENATFGSAFTKLGLSPNSSLTWHLPKIVGLNLANEMLILNRVLSAKEALQFNLVNKVVSSEALMEEVKKFAVEISQGAPVAFSLTKKLIKESYTNDLKTHLGIEAERIVKTAGTDDFQEGLNAFFEKRQADFKGK